MRKKITSIFLPRLTWFMYWFKPWFEHTEGIKEFANQVMQSLMEQLFSLSSKLNQENEKLSKQLEAGSAKLVELQKHPIIEADDYSRIKSWIVKMRATTYIGIIAEGVLNFFAVKSILPLKGWLAICVQFIVALFLTVGGFVLFERLLNRIINKKKYKQESEPAPRNWIELGFMLGLAFAYEWLLYFLCYAREISLAGKNISTELQYFVTISGMLLPLIVGWAGYEKSIYWSAYKNTIDIAALKKIIEKIKTLIGQNEHKLKDFFKQMLEREWAFFREFQTYKENYNVKKGIEKEPLSEHFCETQDKFLTEAERRHAKVVLQASKESIKSLPIHSENGVILQHS